MAKSRIVTVGGGFAGLAAAKALRNRTNHHLFQPLLYQVATSVLTVNPDCDPNTRSILRNQKNTTVLLGEVTGVGKAEKRVVSAEDRYSTPLHRMFRG